ncbi:uncharacterized protein LOC122919503 isoform X2 [Bufo gargarizans]|uniref:uncharacterized protein LOC122919503 isoform X2 n=1 Tax=Bufo gargarizans TaxID=30331 RepID=UPI001CF15E57|nr:uncharacterized protein LOC122919503 isoform X2 [Bufo gargarizans]
MTDSKNRRESLYLSIGVLAVSAGSLLLSVEYYSVGASASLIPPNALGILLLILAAILGYAGIQNIQGHVPLWVSFYWTVSALWCGYGVNLILKGTNVISNSEMRNAIVPGLVAFFLGLFIIGIVGILQKEIVLALISITLSLSSIHEIVLFHDGRIGTSAVACNYLIVVLLGIYFIGGRTLHRVNKKHVILPGTDITNKSNEQEASTGSSKVALIATGFILNMAASSVFGCKLLGITSSLFVGQVAWLWTAAVYQTVICILSYRNYHMLEATHIAFFSILRYAEGYSLLYQFLNTGQLNYPLPFLVVFTILFVVLALFTSIQSLIQSIYLLFYVAYCISLACNPHGFFYGGPQGVNIAIYIVSAIIALITLYNAKSSMTIPTGEGTIKKLFTNNSIFKLRKDKDIIEPYLGYSKYGDAEILAHACSILAAFAMTMPGNPGEPLVTVVLPWVVVAGGIYNLICGSVAFSRGKTLESSAFILYGVMWVIWGIFRYSGIYSTSRGFNTSVGIICFILFNSFIVFSTLFLTKAWFAYALTFQLILISFLLDAINALPLGYDIAVTIIFGLAGFYLFLSTLHNSTFEAPLIPVGSPFIKISGFTNDRSKCPHLISTRTSSVQKIAEIMKNGGICGIPTDTVYVLVAACNQPEAVEKAYKTKRQAQDRPMSLWISSLQQLKSAKHLLSPLLWDFMEAAWPSSISLVIPRGPWLDVLGAHDSAKYIGTPQSIAIRIPDCAVTTHLIDMVGPIAVTSANPSGEADTTHHNQVYAKLGDKVFQIFDQVQQRHKKGLVNMGFSGSTDEITQDINPNSEDNKSYVNNGFTSDDESQ